MRPWKAVMTVLIVLVGLTTNGLAQGYESIFGDSSTSWKIGSGVISQGSYRIDSISIYDTTVINGKIYKSLNQNPNIAELIREDTATGKVWFHNGDEEILIMNMSLNTSDSFYIGYDTRQEIDSGWQHVDSVFVENGRKHIFFFDSHSSRYKDTLKFIEGIGPNLGFNVRTSENQYLICAHKDNRTVYFDPSPYYRLKRELDTFFQRCPERGTLITSIEEKVESSKVKLYPIPASSSIKMNVKQVNSHGRPMLLQLFSASGEEIFSKTIQEDQLQIQKPGKGNIFFYRLFNHEGVTVDKGKILFAR